MKGNEEDEKKTVCGTYDSRTSGGTYVGQFTDGIAGKHQCDKGEYAK
ncbi:unknown [Hungatella hathewayi CAG:224]|nr:unknown [Hungatella hathewayi CAG:224]